MTTSKTRYAELKSKGICPHCEKRPVIPGRAICETCKAATYPNMASARKRRYHERKAAGTCTRCGKNPPVSDELECASCKQYLSERRAKRTPDQIQHHAEVSRAWREANPERLKTRDARYVNKLKQDILDHYGHKCACCGEGNPAFLTLDHVDGGGNAHRRKLTGAAIGGRPFYRRIRAMGYPDGLQTLCWNCNMAKAHYGTCPHQTQ